MLLRKGLDIKKNRLFIGGCDTVGLAKEFGTPIYVMDEEFIRLKCKEYVSAVKEYGNGLVCYASKAFSCKEIYRIAASEGMGTDVVSGGELQTCAAVGFPMDKVYFHGNNKTEAELRLAIKYGVRAVVIDSLSEIGFLQRIAAGENAKVSVLVRLNPGIDAHTHQSVKTASEDSKFGCPVSDGTAYRAVKEIAASANLEFTGLHTHIGSQIFELEPYETLIDCFVKLSAEIKKTLGLPVKEFNLGGGFGIRYTDADGAIDFHSAVKHLAGLARRKAAGAGLDKPFLVFEPGRSIVAESGITLYTVGAVKESGSKKFIAVDGGMFENPRYALYGARYGAIIANKADLPPVDKVSVAGKCCESGDIIIGETALGRAERGDILAVLYTGAYNFSMAGNYNRNPVPPVVMVKDGKARVIVRGQSYEDVSARDL